VVGEVGQPPQRGQGLLRQPLEYADERAAAKLIARQIKAFASPGERAIGLSTRQHT
jgi:hypothetical protein